MYKPVGYPEDQTTPENHSVAKLNGTTGGNKIGPSLVLRLMAGDTVQISGKAFFKSQGQVENKSKAPTEDMVASLIRAFGVLKPERGNTHPKQLPIIRRLMKTSTVMTISA